VKPPPPRPDVTDAVRVGYLSLVTGVLALVSTLVTAQLFESSPVWIFVVGAILGKVSLWFFARAVKAPGGSHGRGIAAAGMILAIIGILFSGFGAAIQSALNADTL
jgi:hypothetical protein